MGDRGMLTSVRIVKRLRTAKVPKFGLLERYLHNQRNLAVALVFRSHDGLELRWW